MTDDRLIFDADFEELATAAALDRSPLRRPVLAVGSPTTIRDRLLGVAARLDGASGLQVTLPEQGARTAEFTIEAWVRVDELPASGDARILKFGATDRDALVWNLDSNGTLSIALAPHDDKIAFAFPLGAWRHIAVVADGGGLAAFLDGAQVGTTLAHRIDPRTSELMVGATPEAGAAAGLVGALARLRVYKVARDGAALVEQIMRDRTPLGNFDNANPLNLRLLDNGDRPVIYIDDLTRGQPLTLEIQNVSTHEVRFPKKPNTSATLKLVFRPGTLHQSIHSSRKTPVNVVQHERWQPANVMKRNDGTVEIALHPQAKVLPIALAPGQTELVTLNNIHAEAGSGTRSSQVQFEYAGLSSDDPILEHAEDLSGRRDVAITVVNHDGRPNAPLSVTLTGDGKVLPGSNGQSLTLNITNTAETRPLQLTPDTTFTVHVQSGTSNRAALLVGGKLEVANTAVTPQAWSVSLDDPNAENPGLQIRPAQARTLAPHETIAITLSKLDISTLPGRAPIRVTHSHLPGFWYGAHDLTVDKTALSEDDGGQVGIGLEPEKPLHIKGRKSEGFDRSELIGFSDQNGDLKWDVSYQDGLNWVESGEADFRFFMGNRGRIGIGTGTPEYDFHMIGAPASAVYMNIASRDGEFAALQLEAQGYPKAEISASEGTMAIVNSGENLYIGTSAVGSLYWRKDVLESDDVRVRWDKDSVVVNKTFTSNDDAVFRGDVSIDGTLTAKVKNFVIPHPDRPADVLVHSCLEGPEAGVYYRGEGVLADGRAEITLPAYFERLTLVKGRTVHLTAQGRTPFLLSYEPVLNGRFVVHGSNPDGAFSWEVRAIRADVDPVEPEPGGGRT